MKYLVTLLASLIITASFSQTASISGKLLDEESNPVPFANVVLYQAADSAIYKVEASNEEGRFDLVNLNAGSYYLVASFVGTGDIKKEGISLADGEALDLGSMSFGASTINLQAASVVTERSLVEVKPDRIVFNVQGTINSTGDNAMSLMRKAPGVTVDNNDNINVLGRSGVIVYVDGKLLPLSGDELAAYLRNIPSDQIDRIDVITNPGAKYDAEGNAGIIDIRMKKDENLGANGTVSGTLTQGQRRRGNVNLIGNYRNKHMNLYGNLGYFKGQNLNNIFFVNWQNDLLMDEEIRIGREWEGLDYRVGADFFLGKNHTIGFMTSGNDVESRNWTEDIISIALAETEIVDSVLVADSNNETPRTNTTYNINYRYEDREKNRSLNVDFDYGTYSNESDLTLLNKYWDSDFQQVLTEVNNYYDAPTYIDIYTAKFDYEDQLFGGKLGLGAKYSQVISDNTFLVFDEADEVYVQNDTLSNIFEYDETVYAGYIEYNRKIGEKVGMSGGLRAELTDATGNLQAFIPELVEPPVEQYYWRYFPNLGITYNLNQKNVLSASYGRRINRPDYNVLNPFNSQLSQISYEKGNPRLQPEIVNNAELGWTHNYRYNFKIAYSKTTDQITRLIGPDDTDPRANFITWANLASQEIFSFNASLPMEVTKWWRAYLNLSASYIDNQADYGEDGFVDVQAYSYNIYTQNTFTLPWALKGEISGWFSGPGVWGGVFLYDESWSLNVGLQRLFLDNLLSVRISANDLFYESGWSGTSDFNGLYGEGRGNWDSRWVSMAVSYNFGNQKVKSRDRKTGLEEEAGRVGGD